MPDSRAQSKHRVVVLKVVAKQLSTTTAAAEYGISRQHPHRLLRRYRDGGLEALEPPSRRPRTQPRPDAEPGPRADRRAAHAAGERRSRCRTGHDRLAPGAGWVSSSVDLDRPAHRVSQTEPGSIKVGAVHARPRVLAIADERDVTVVALHTGEVLSTHLLEPDRSYWRNR